MLWYPGEAVTSSRASQFSTNAGYNMSSPLAQNPPASDIDFVYLAGREMVTPGVYTLLLVAKSGTPRINLQVRAAYVCAALLGSWPGDWLEAVRSADAPINTPLLPICHRSSPPAL